MKHLSLFCIAIVSLLFSATTSRGQRPGPAVPGIELILSSAAHRAELTRINALITTFLADQRRTDQAVRQMVVEAKTELEGMLNQKVITNPGKVLDLAKWMDAQALEQNKIHKSEVTPTAQQQLVMDNPLAGQIVYLVQLLQWILTESVQCDEERAGAENLEAFLQIYLNFRRFTEGSDKTPSNLLWCARPWIQTRFPQLTAEQKRQFLADANESRRMAAIPDPDSVPGTPATAAEKASYEAAYKFIVEHTPKRKPIAAARSREVKRKGTTEKTK